MKLSYSAATLVAALAVSAHAAENNAANLKSVERGRYLAESMGCQDCHSPKIIGPEGIPHPDASKAYSGHPGSKLPTIDKKALVPGNWYMMSPDLTAYVGPWGVSYAANITPDEQTGIGLWTEDIFVQSIRTGKHMGAGRPILPPMPWMYYTNLSDDDLKAIYAYLRSLKPIKNAVPAPIAAADVK
jgi:hypothetical protein